MSIAIFGDSFAAEHSTPYQLPQDHKGWTSIVAEQFTVDNYAVSGSSLYYSWDKFNQLHGNYDRVIFLVSNWDRHYIDLGPETTSEHTWMQHQCSINQVDDCLGKLGFFTLDSNKAKLKALKDYWVHVGNDRQRQQMHRLMITDIINQRPDCLIMSGFMTKDSLFDRPRQADLCKASMMDVVHYFGKELNWDLTLWGQQYQCQRHNHLNRFNNQILADAVVKWLRTHDINELVDLPWCADTDRDWSYYFRKIS
jgi:hypothetical protein